MNVADRTKSINLELLEEMFQIEEKEKVMNAGKLEKFENAALFLRLGLPSTLIHPENAALFLQLGLPSTLIRHENAALFL